MNGMGPLNEMKIELEGIGHLLADQTLAVPVYQRAYAWTAKKEVAEFLQDLATAIERDEPEYFLGTVVVARGSTGRPEVVDGQQRLATTTILIAAIRDYFYNTGDTERAAQIEGDYLMVKALRTQETSPRLQLNEQDSDFFCKRILSRPDSPDRQVAGTKPSHQRIAEAASAAERKVGELVRTTGKPTEQMVV